MKDRVMGGAIVIPPGPRLGAPRLLAARTPSQLPC